MKIHFKSVHPFRWPVLSLLILLNLPSPGKNPLISIVSEQNPGRAVQHGLTSLTSVLKEKNIPFEQAGSLKEAKGKWIILAGRSDQTNETSALLKKGNHVVPGVPEALTIWKTSHGGKPVIVAAGFDDTGLMYALLDLSRQTGYCDNPENLYREITGTTEKPDLAERAVSVYTMNRAYWESRFYDEKYWEKYLNLLAENRFNSLVVIFGYENGGFLAPCYPYFFDVEEFPQVKMTGITRQEQQKNSEAFNRLIRMAHQRGIRLTAGIWDHIYRGGVQGGGIPGANVIPDKPVPGLVWGVTTENLTAYTKAALAKFVRVFPGLDAIQFRMHNESGLRNEEKTGFWDDVFKMMKSTVPGLQLDLRAKELPDEVVRSAISNGITFRITTKYWMEQMGMPFHPTRINPEKSPRRHSYADMLHYPQEYRMHWRLWNGGTARILLWGDPEYVRRFCGSAHLYEGNSFEVNEPLATKMEAQPHDMPPFQLLNAPYRYYDYEFERYWHFFQLFGRLGYNPSAAPEIWEREFERRFGKEAAPFVEQALHKASWILPRIVASVYPYSGFPMTRGWAEKQSLGTLENYARNTGSDLQQFATFDDEAQMLMKGGGIARVLPSMTSRWFSETAEEISQLVGEAEKNIGNKSAREFISTLTDLKILSGLAQFHARRIPAAVSYRLFERTGDVSALDKALDYEQQAIDAWRQMVEAAGDIYTADLMMGVRTANLCGHWKEELEMLEKGWKDLQQKRKNVNTGEKKLYAPEYKPAERSGWADLFRIEHTRITRLALGEPLKIRIKVTAPSGIKTIEVNHRSVNQDMDFQTIPMEQTGEPGVYEVVIPATEINPRWDYMYLFSILDNENHGLIYPDFRVETPYIMVKLVR